LTGTTPSAISFGPTSGTIAIPSTTDAVDSNSGALVVAGGVGIKGDFFNINTPFSSNTRTTAHFDNLVVNGALNFNTGSTLTVENLIVDGNLTVVGALTYTNLVISQTLTVNGMSYLNGGISVVQNSVSQFSVGTTGITIIGPSGGTNAILTVNGDLTVNGGIEVNTQSGAVFTVDGLTGDTVASTLALGQGATIGTNALAVNGTSVLNGQTTLTDVIVNSIVGGGIQPFSIRNLNPNPGDYIQIGNISPNTPLSVVVISGGNTSSSDTGANPSAGFIVQDGGAYIKQDLMVYGGNIYGPTNPSQQPFNIGPSNTTINIGDTSGKTSTITIGGSCTAQTFTSTSDYRIKENIQNLDESFNVDKLRPVTYTNKNTKKQDIGFIAHEVQEEFPYLVSGEKDGEEMQSLNYIGLIGVLVKEIQELKKRVSILENK